jgi:isocitrate dehydrogenase
MSVTYKIKLEKDEGQAFENFKKMVKPPGITDDDFNKLVFLRGIEHINLAIRQELERLKTEDPAKYAEITAPPTETPDTETAQ